ncbi:hypothetical protein C3489_36445 [Streptomyces sp. Ru71]|uniref:DUF4232 domain-containing protein n=1 Tax=Streptomyces sp. Ru71 TaxID=2080746 RepID=UPI000CDD2528|nr:hypothetical protein C3489_36445 [Streptomyces sp. Ru71]
MNHGPDDQSPAGLDSDELALRRMLHQAVEEIEPRDGALDHLRRAVPARRARKRQAAVGMAAAALFVGTAVPALVHVSQSTGSDPDPSIAANSSQAQGGTGQGKDPSGGQSAGTSATGSAHDKGEQGKKDPQKGKPSEGGASATAGPSAASPASVPECTSAQLGDATASAEAPDSAGIVYGVFRVQNVSDAPCAVAGAGTVGFTAQGAADATRISVVEHAAGDAAAGLPDPSLYVSRLVLAPGSAYDVKFAWVPSDTCPTSGGGSSSGGPGGGGETGAPSPDPSPSQDAATDTGTSTGGETGTTTQLVTEDGTADGSVTVTHTAQTGSPSASATVTGACSGTVYRTGLLAES